MAEYELRKGSLAVRFQNHGAEMISLVKDGTEYLWCGDPAYWGRHAPVLFPFVGQVWDGKYRFRGREYRMGQHGFARDMDFVPGERSEDAISFVLHENEETLAKYPFRFELEIRYAVRHAGDTGEPDGKTYGKTDRKTDGKTNETTDRKTDGKTNETTDRKANETTGGKYTVTVEWIVRNPGEEPLYFSIGGHPAFLCPRGGRGTWADSHIGIAKNGRGLSEIEIRPITEKGCFGDKTVTLRTENGMLIPSDGLFAGDALVLENGQTDHVALIGPDGKEYLAVDSAAPCMGIWSPVGKHAPFICIEPWYGRADRVGFEGDLSEREYGNMLAPGEIFDHAYTITV